jgi:membrane associated rhomboid family serine protease
LVFGISIFAVRYAMGVLFGVLPPLRGEPFWIYASGAVGGMVAGIGIGWLVNLLRRARRSTRVASCA